MAEITLQISDLPLWEEGPESLPPGLELRKGLVHGMEMVVVWDPIFRVHSALATPKFDSGDLFEMVKRVMKCRAELYGTSVH